MHGVQISIKVRKKKMTFDLRKSPAKMTMSNVRDEER